MRVSIKPLSNYPIFIRPFFWNQKRKYGEVLKPGMLWGRVPKLFAAVALLYGVLDRRSSPLDPVLRSLVTVRVSQINWCSFCVDINSSTLAKRTGSMEKVAQLHNWRESELFDAKEKIALAYTEAVTYSDQQVTGELMDQLKTFYISFSILQ